MSVSSLAQPVSSANVSSPGNSEHEWARSAVRAGEILPFGKILNRLEREFVGQVLKIGLQREKDHVVYEIELITPKGHVIELRYDAHSGILVGADGPDIDGARRQTSPMSVLRP